jgi:hypothetical protein
MSHISTGILGAVAVSLTLGAIQFASGSDLGSSNTTQADSSPVNRTTKADRLTPAPAPVSAYQGQTLSFRINSLADTSVLMRLTPVRVKLQAVSAAPSNVATFSARPFISQRKVAVACEPVVSVLTEVAKLLEPGRCVT